MATATVEIEADPAERTLASTLVRMMAMVRAKADPFNLTDTEWKYLEDAGLEYSAIEGVVDFEEALQNAADAFAIEYTVISRTLLGNSSGPQVAGLEMLLTCDGPGVRLTVGRDYHSGTVLTYRWAFETFKRADTTSIAWNWVDAFIGWDTIDEAAKR